MKSLSKTPSLLDTNTTMSSVELVILINKARESGQAELAHPDFMKKIVKVLGASNVGNFSGIYKDGRNRDQPCYHLPRREASLMVMSESYKVQAAVYDRWQELEHKTHLALPDFHNPAAAARAWAEQYEQAQIAIATKAEIGSRREATAMNTASQAVRKANKLERELDQSREFCTIKRMSMLHHGQPFSWRLLKSTAAEMGIAPIDVFDANYGSVKAYHSAVWCEAYALEIPAVGGAE